MSDAGVLVLRDLQELAGGDAIGVAVLLATLLLPGAGVLLLWMGRRRGGAAVLVLSAGTVVYWFSYYAVDVLPVLDVEGFWILALVDLIGWVLVTCAVLSHHRGRSAITGPDVRRGP